MEEMGEAEVPSEEDVALVALAALAAVVMFTVVAALRCALHATAFVVLAGRRVLFGFVVAMEAVFVALVVLSCWLCSPHLLRLLLAALVCRALLRLLRSPRTFSVCSAFFTHAALAALAARVAHAFRVGLFWRARGTPAVWPADHWNRRAPASRGV